MGGDWTDTTVGSFCPFIYGKGLPKKKRIANGNIRVYGSNGPVGAHDQPLVDESGIVIGRKGTVGAVHFSPDPFWPIDTTFYVVGATNRDLRFTYYLLKSLGLEHMNADSAVPGLNRDAAHARQIIVPNLPEQRAIAHILGTLDDKIELNRKMNKTLEETARAIFKSWFVDFDPVHAKAEGRDTGLPKEVANLFPDSFEDSELGKVPKGWKVKPIGDVVQCVGGSTPSTKNPAYWVGGTNPFVTPRDMSKLTSPVILDTERHITDAGVEKISSRMLPIGTVLLSSRAPIGYLAVAEVPVSANQGFIAMLCNGELPTQYVLRWVEENMNNIKANAGGTTFAEISKKNFRPIPALVPSRNVLTSFVNIVEPMHENIVKNVKEIDSITDIRDTLLRKLISGDLRVKGVMKIIGYSQ